MNEHGCFTLHGKDWKKGWQGGEGNSLKKAHRKKRRKRPVEQRFWEKVDKGLNDETCCWNWIGSTTHGKGSKSPYAYGRFFVGGRRIPAHWFLLPRYPDASEVACHKCDNGSCVRPSHIFIGTQKENTRDSINKGRWNMDAHRITIAIALNSPNRKRCGILNHAHKLTEQQTIEAINCDRKHGAAAAMARRFGVSLSLICKLRSGIGWSELQPQSNTNPLPKGVA